MADRHYNRQRPGSLQFAPPGRTLVLLADRPARALFIWSWQRFAFHAWPGAWVCSCFRNEGAGLSSEMIRSAVGHAVWRWGSPPEAGVITFVRPSAVRPKARPGECFLHAGWELAGATKKGLIVLRLADAANCRPLEVSGV